MKQTLSSDIFLLQGLMKKRKEQVFLVGGFLRDHLLGISSCDFDFAVSRNALALAQAFAKKIKGAYILLDKEHGCARVAKKREGQLWTFDFADFRGRTIKEDLKKRDFTINTLAMDLRQLEKDTDLTEKISHQEKPLDDIQRKKIRRVSAQAFRDDPLRMLRAFSLWATLDFSIEPVTLAQIKKEREKLNAVSVERVREEFFKILDVSKTGNIISVMAKMGFLEVILPQVHIMYDCPQGGYHHLDVWPHSLETVKQLDRVLDEFSRDKEVVEYLNQNIAGDHSRRAVIKLAALLHDIGKPETRKIEKGRYSFHGHEHVGERIVREMARMLKLATRERYMLEDMVRGHLRPGYLSNFKKPTEKALYRYMRDTKDEAVAIALLSLADQRATRGALSTKEHERHHEKICREIIARYFAKQKEKPFVRLIDGHDLIKRLKLKPSPLFAKILSAVEEQQTLGKIKTKDEALTLAKSMAMKKDV